MAMFDVGIGLGSNIGDKAANIREAVRRLCADGRVRLSAMSAIYRTAPWGPVEQDFFANACALVQTALAPLELLGLAKSIEAEMGRAQSVRWGPRLIDLDLLFYGDLVLDEPHLKLPHPQVLHRAFVLVPLAEIAADKMIAGRSIATAAAAVGPADVTLWENP